MAIKTGQYSSVDELPDLLQAKKTDYKSVDELPDLKKKSGSVSSSTGGTVGSSKTQSDASTDPFAMSKAADEFSKKTIEIPNEDLRNNAAITKQVPDEKSIKASKDILLDLEKQGFKKDFLEGIKDLPEDVYNFPETSKERLVEVYKDNPLKFKQLTNEAKIKTAVRNAAYENANNNLPDDENKDYYARQAAIIESNKYSGDTRDVSDINGVFGMLQDKQNIINANISNPDQKKDLQNKLKETYAPLINPDTPGFKEDYEQSGLSGMLDEVQYAGLKTMQMFEPEKYEQTLAFLKNPIEELYTHQMPMDVVKNIQAPVAIPTSYQSKESKGGKLSQQTIDEKIGMETRLRELANIGRENTYTDIENQKLDLQKQINSLPDGNPLKNELIEKYNESVGKINRLSLDAEQDDKKYPLTAQLKFDQQTADITGKAPSLVNNAAIRFAMQADNPRKSFYSLFGNSPSLQRQMIGESESLQNELYLPEKFRRANSPVIPVYPKDVEEQIKKISDDPSLNFEEKKAKRNEILLANQNRIKTITNPNEGSSKNFFSKATAYTMSSFLGDVGGMAFAMAGNPIKGKLGEMLSMGALTHNDYYTEAVKKGLSDPNGYANLHSGIVMLATTLGTQYDLVKKAIRAKPATAGLLDGISEKTWNDVVSKSSGKISQLKSSLGNAIKENTKMVALWGGAVPAAQSLSDNAFYGGNKSGQEIANESYHGMIDMAIGQLPLAMANVVTGYKGQSNLRKSLLWEIGDNKDIQIQRIQDKIDNGQLSKIQGDKNIATVKEISSLIDEVPIKDKKDKLLTDEDRQDYLYNLYIKNKAKEQSGFPKDAKEDADHTALVADYTNNLILNPKTEEQLNSSKEKLEKDIEKKDENGKLVLNEKDLANAKAELEAVNNAIENNKNNVSVEPPKEVPESVPLVESKEEIPVDANGVKVELPKQVAEVVPLKESPLDIINTLEGKIPDMEFMASKSNPELALREIADQALGLGRDSEGNRLPLDISAPEPQLDAVTRKYGKEVVDKAIEMFPPENKINEEAKVTEDTNTQTATGKKEPPKEPTEPVGEGKPKKDGITHAAVEELRKIIGEPEYEGKPVEKHEKLIEEAQATIKEDKNAANEVLDKMENGGKITNKDNAIAAVYKATIDAEMAKNPTPELLKRATRLSKALDASGTELGKALESRKLVGVEDNLTNFLLEKQAAQGTALTEPQLKAEAAKYEELKAAKEALEKQLEVEREQHAKDIAELGLNKAKAKAKRESKKSSEDYKKERKDTVEAARKALKDIRDNPQASAAPLFRELVAIAPHVKEYVNSLVSEGVDKLDNIVTAVHAEFKDVLEGLTKRDVLDIMAGEYNGKQKEQTRNEKANTARLLEREAKLLKELERERKGEEKAKTESQKVQSNRRIDELKEKIKEVRRLNKNREIDKESPEDATAGEIEYNTKLQKQLTEKAQKLTNDIRNKKYLEEEPAKPVFKRSRKTQILEDRVIDLENKIRHERSLDEYNKRSKLTKYFDKFMEVLGLRRLFQSALDMSVPFRQGATMISPRKIDVWAKGFQANLKSVFNPKKFERIQYEIRHDPQYNEMVKDGVRFNDMNSADPLLHNEDFRKSFIYKIPIISEPLKASNRSADAFLNTTRYEMYKKMRNNLEKKGYTRESDPEAFHDIANWVMNMTGSGKKHKIFDSQSMNRALGNTFYGANLMASRLNLLNPLTYFDARRPKAVRYEAMKDMVAFTGTMMSVATALAYTTGAKVSLNPDDSDFLQIRYGDKVYDISGGLANYVRTGLRIAKAAYTKSTGTKYEGQKATDNAGKSVLNFFRNKLSPNTAYSVDAFFGGRYGNEFDPIDIARIYPMYTEDFLKAVKEEGGLMATTTVLLPNILGIGYGSYASKGQIDKNLDDLLQRNMRSDEMNNEKIYNHNAGGRPVTYKEFNEFADLRDKKIEADLKVLFEKGINGKAYKDLTQEELVKETNYIKGLASREAKEELFGKDKKTRTEKRDTKKLSKEHGSNYKNN